MIKEDFLEDLRTTITALYNVNQISIRQSYTDFQRTDSFILSCFNLYTGQFYHYNFYINTEMLYNKTEYYRVLNRITLDFGYRLYGELFRKE